MGKNDNKDNLQITDTTAKKQPGTLHKTDTGFEFDQANLDDLISNIKKSEANLKAIFENSSESLFLTDTAGIIIALNDNARKTNLLTCNEEMVTGRNILDYITSERQHIFRNMMLKVCAGEYIQYEQCFDDLHGNYHCFDFSINPVYEDGVIKSICYNGRDITARNLAEEKTKQNERRYRALVENGGDAVAILSTTGKPLYVSPSIEKVMGYTEEEAMQLDLFSITHPNDMIEARETMALVMASPGVPVKGHIWRALHKDGSWRWYEKTITNMLHDPAIGGIVDNFRDITKRTLAEQKRIHANRLYAFISGINQAIVHAKDEQTVFDEVCRIAVEVGKFKMAWIGIADKEQEKISMVACQGILPEDMKLFINVKYDTGGPQDRALHTGEYYVCNDIENDLETVSRKPFAAKYGIRSCMVMPVKRSGEGIGALNLYASELNLFDAQEILLLEEITGDISFALDVFEKEKHRKLMEDKAIHANRLYAFISQINQTIVYAENEQVVFKETCRIAIEVGKFKIAWIGIFDAENEKMSLVEGRGIQQEDAALFNNAGLHKNGPQSRALHTGAYYVCNDIENDLEAVNWKPFSAKYGIRSSMLLPVKKSGNTIGTINLYSSELNFFDAQEIELLQEIASDISFALDVFEKEQHRKQMEEMVAHNELHLNQAQAIAHFGSWELDLATGIETWSEEACRIYGLPVTENKQSFESWLPFIHPADLDHVMGIMKESGEKLSDSAFYHRIIRRDGTVRHLYSKSHFEFSKEGKPVSKYGIAHDITEQKEADEKIIVANRLYAFISAVNQTIVHAEDEQTVFNEACRIAIDIGKFELALIGMPGNVNGKLNIIAHANTKPGDLEFFKNLIYDDGGPAAEVFRTGKPHIINDYENEPLISGTKNFAMQRGFKSCILLPVKRSGKTTGVYNLYSNSTNLFDEEEIRLLEEAANDISFALDVFEKEQHRKQMEEKVAHSELRLKQAQAIAHFGSWELDLATGIAEWSEEACRIYGLAPEDNLQTYQSWLSFVHPEDLDYVIRQTKESERTLSNSGFHHRIIRRDGTVRHIYSQAQFELDNDDKLTGLKGVEHDVTETKEGETERIKMMADIVQRNKDLEQFSYIVSHNLRAPVANILGIVDIMQTIGINKEEEEKVAGFLGTAAQDLDNVIRDLSQILEVKHNAQQKRENLKFSALLNEIKSGLGFLIKNEQVQISSDFSAVNEISTMKSYMYSIFFNLITNSIKYRQQGIAPLIEITSAISGNTIQLVFKDNGIGIDLEKNRKDVFGLNKRFHTHVAGKGIGLYMVKAQVETLGGTITVASEVNKGTEFTIEFEINQA